MQPPFIAPGNRAVQTSPESLPSIDEFLDELPSIDDFVDHTSPELPSISQFVADEPISEGRDDARDPDWFEQGEYDADGWAMTGWQDFDWTGAAALGAQAVDSHEANSAWDASDWDVPSARTSEQVGGHATPSADEVAQALDGIARRIRSGELVLDQLSGTPPEAAMAAALATLLRMRG